MASSQIIVIGAGPAGIAAARELKALGFKKVVVLEAANRVGGRVINSGEFDDPKIREISRGTVELGPSFIHGDCENEFLDYLKANGARIKPGIKTTKLAWPNYFYFGKEAKLLSGEEAEKDADLQRMLEVYEMLDGLDAKLIPEETLLQYFVRMGVPSRVLDMADAIFANDYGADMSTIGLKETVEEQHAWKYGEDYLILEGCTYSDVFHHMARASPRQLCTVITSIIST
jgi:monoamine oxidase